MSSPASSAPKILPNTWALLRDTFHLYREHAGVYLGYAGWLLLPLIGIVLTRITLGNTGIAQQISYVLNGISLVIDVWVFASIAEATHMLKTHGKLAPSRMPFLTIFLVLIAYSVLLFAGLTLFLIPGLLFITWFSYAPIVATLDHGGFVAAFVTSKNLVQGLFWTTFSRIWGMYLAVILVYLAVAFALSLFFPDMLTLNPSVAMPLPVDSILSLTEILLTPIIVVYLTLLYLARKNG